MFSLVKFHNDKFSVIKSKTVQELDKTSCVVKYNGGKYSAFLISKSDNKSELLNLKQENEEKHFSKNSPSTSSSKLEKNIRAVSSSLSSTFVKTPCEIQSIVILDKYKFFDSNSTLISPIKRLPVTEAQHNVTDEALKGIQYNAEQSSIVLGKSNEHNAYTQHSSEYVEESTYSDHISEPSKTVNKENENTASEIEPNCEDSLVNRTTVNNALDFSSSKQSISTFSEYIPEYSTNMSEDISGNQNKNQSDQNETVEEIDMPLNVDQVLVPYSKTNIKKHFCIFCKTLQCKISRHFFLKHKDEDDIKKASVFPKKSLERLQILNKLRKKGDFEHNTSAEYNTGIFIVSRQQQQKFKNNVDNYVCCKSCKGFFSKRTIRLHRPNCGSSKKGTCSAQESRRLTQFVHPVASKALKLTVFPILRSDAIGKSIRYDELIIKYGNKLVEKYSSQHLHDMIRANLRLLGRFVMEVKKLDTTINELKNIYKPQMFDTCIKAERIVAKWNESLLWFENPAVATSLTSLIKKCGNKQRTELIKENREDLKTQLENFLLLWEEEVPLINKKAIEDQSNQKRNKKVILPLKEDIKKLYDYLKNEIVNAIDNISENFSTAVWIKLVETTLIFTQIFNRRRAGEIERLSIENFKSKESITEIVDKDILKTVSEDSLKFAKQFVRISLRGKLGRTVAILLCPMSVRAIELIMQYRNEAGVTDQNNYVFGKPTSSKLAKPYFRACPLLNKFSRECGAKFAGTLRGTTLRKHIATHTALLNVEEASVERLANFMGHHKEIHKNIYRMSIPVAEITCVSKLLMAAVGEEGDVEDDEDDDEENEIFELGKNVGNHNVEEKGQENNQSSSSSCKRKRRSTSPYGKTKRCRWSASERKAITSIFGNIMTLEKLPPLADCLNAIRQSPALCNRTPEQVKSWIDNQRRYKDK